MITVFTCTYNREMYLANLYHSLQRQDDKDFEWLIIDDGSTDGTQSYITQLMKQEMEFNIIYHKFSNGGKHRAINRGMPYVNGEYVFLVDSDDELTENAIRLINSWILTIRENKRMAGVSGLKAFYNGKIMGEIPKIKNDYIDVSYIERYKYGLRGDKIEVYRTDILRKFPFPEFEGENFIAEGIVWNRIAKDGYWIRWFPQVVYLGEYLEEGLTKDNNKIINNWNGFLCLTKEAMEMYKGCERMRTIVRFIYYARKKGFSKKYVLNELKVSISEYYVADLVAFVYPFWKERKLGRFFRRK